MKPKPRRKSTLADRFLSNTETKVLVSAKRFAYLYETLQNAPKWVLDEKAAAYAANLIAANPDLPADAMDFAIPPFEKMWIEMPFRTFFQELTGLEQGDRELNWENDDLVGYLIDWPRVYIVGSSKRDPEGWILPIAYHLNQPATFEEELGMSQLMGISRAQLDLFYWGWAFDKIRPENQIQMRANHKVVWLNPQDDEWKEKQALEEAKKFLGPRMFEGCKGELKTIIALLLLLNRPSHITYREDVKPGPGMVKNKSTTLVKHTKVVFKLEPKEMLKVISPRGLGPPRREHGVRGHFCHNREGHPAMPTNHVHEWTEYKPNSWRCLHCPGKRWFKKEHRRGKLSQGLVIKDYEVTQ